MILLILKHIMNILKNCIPSQLQRMFYLTFPSEDLSL